MDKERGECCPDKEYKKALAEEWWREQEARMEYEWLMHLAEVCQPNGISS